MRARDIIAVSVVLGLSFLSIMVVVARFLWAHPKNAKSEHDEKSEYSLDPVKRKTSIMLTGGVLKKLFTPVSAMQRFPRLSDIWVLQSPTALKTVHVTSHNQFKYTHTLEDLR
jgi:hypothetical protein